MEFLSDSQKDHYEHLCHAKRKMFLKHMMENIEHGPAREGIENMLFELEKEDVMIHSNELRSPYQPNPFDVLIDDITDADLQTIGDELGVHRLSRPRNHAVSYPLQGLMYGAMLRVFVPMVVKRGNSSVNVVFLFATGSANTYIRADTMAALGHVDHTPSNTQVSINGIGITAHLSHGHFGNIDLIGQDFMSFLQAKVTLDYRDKTVEVSVRHND